MKTLLKIVAGIVGVVVVLIVAAVIIVPMVVDPNDYKTEIAQKVREQTGRELIINGDIKLSVFPWLGVRLGEVQLGNAAGFAQPYFAKVDEATVRVKLLPLLGKQVEMDTVMVRGLDVNLARAPDGKSNWDDLARSGAESTTTGSSSSAGASEPPAIAALAIGGVALRDASLTFADAGAGSTIKVQNLNAETGPVALGRPVDLSLEFDVEGFMPDTKGTVKISGAVSPDMTGDSVSIQGLSAQADLTGPALPGGKASVTAGARTANLVSSTQRLEVEGLEVATTGLALGGPALDLKASAGLTGDLAKQVFDLRSLRADGKVAGDGIPGGAVEFTAEGSARADLATGLVAAPGLKVTVPRLALDKVTGSIALSTDLAANLGERRFTASGLAIDGDFSGDALPGGKLPLRLRADAAVDQGKDTLTLSGLTIEAAKLTGTGEMTVSALSSGAPAVAGRIAIADANPRALLALAGQTAPATADPKALSKLSIRTGIKADARSASLEDLVLTLDGATIKGSVAVPDLARQALAFDLSVDDLDVDRYLPPPAARPAGGATAAASAPATPGAAAAGAAGLPMATLRALDLDGRFRATKLGVSGLKLAGVDVTLKAKNGRIGLSPLKAGLYGGSYAGNIVLDATGEQVRVNLDEAIEGVRAGALLADLGIKPGVDLSGASSLRIKGAAVGDPAKQTYRVDGLAATVDLAGKDFPGGKLAGSVKGDVDLDLGKQTLASPSIALAFGGSQVLGNINVTSLLSAPQYQAKVSMPTFNPRNVLAALGQPPVKTADPKALAAAELSATVKGSTTSVRLDDLAVRLDQTTLKGFVEVKRFAPLAAAFDLAVDDIDADRYLPPSGGGGGGAAGGAGGGSARAATPAAAAPLIPIDLVRSLDLDGKLTIGSLRIAKLKVSNVKLVAKGKDKQLALHPVDAALYGGTYSGNIRIDGRPKVPVLSVDENLQGVQAGPLLKDMTGSQTLRGTANFSAKLGTRGVDEATLRRNLDGTVAAHFRDGAIVGVDLIALLCTGLSALDFKNLDKRSLGNLITGVIGQAIADKRQRDGGQATGSGQETKFAELVANLDVKDGVARNDDLALKSPLVRVGGSGTFDLVREQADYLAQVALVASCKGQGGLDADQLSKIPIPVKVSGPFQKLKYEPDFRGVLAALGGSRSRSGTAPTAGAPAAAPAPPTQAPAPAQAPAPTPQKPEDAVKQILKEGLKGLFK
ncbi:MAG: AsmA family protein [Ectothiorhodospiraceae bacterium]|nr:AsmA family protein [Chromatiales bacterium]MCP5153276.1 AsmA family protein [Ectothiorhodospiraceae bacterium]